jgi:hypothetical protein
MGSGDLRAADGQRGRNCHSSGTGQFNYCHDRVGNLRSPGRRARVECLRDWGRNMDGVQRSGDGVHERYLCRHRPGALGSGTRKVAPRSHHK